MEKATGGIGSFKALDGKGAPLPKPHKGWPNPRKCGGTKGENKLNRRIRDYFQMTAQATFKAPAGAYHRPGSNK